MEEFTQPQEEDLTRTSIIIATRHCRPTQERNSNMVVLIQEAMDGGLLRFLDINQEVRESAVYRTVQSQVGRK